MNNKKYENTTSFEKFILAFKFVQYEECKVINKVYIKTFKRLGKVKVILSKEPLSPKNITIFLNIRMNEG
jgi:hypothetical protein